MIDRRAFLGFAASGALGVATPSFAQRAAAPARIGYLSILKPPTEFTDAFLRGLRELGYVEGTNLVIEYRWSDGDAANVPKLAADLVQRNVALVVAFDGVSVRAVRDAGPTMPIVIPVAGDPVASGLAASFARPGGSVTGLSMLLPELSRKRVEVFREAIPGLQKVGALFNGARREQMAGQVREMEAAADALRLRVVPLGVSIPDGIDAGFAEAAREGLQGVEILSDTFTITYREQLGTAALKHRMPTLFSNRAYLRGGGLMSYGPDVEAMFERAAWYVDRILKGTKPGDLAIEQPTRLELAINPRTARALGVTFPPALLARVDAVIQ